MKDIPNKSGRKTEWSPELGLGVKRSPRMPDPIHKMIKEPAVKRLLNRMALDPEFKARILVMVDELDS